MKGICHIWHRGRHFFASLPGDRYLKLGSKSDHRAETSGNIVRYGTLAPHPEVLRSWYLVCACSVSPQNWISYRMHRKEIHPHRVTTSKFAVCFYGFQCYLDAGKLLCYGWSDSQIKGEMAHSFVILLRYSLMWFFSIPLTPHNSVSLAHISRTTVPLQINPSIKATSMDGYQSQSCNKYSEILLLSPAAQTNN